MEMLAGAEIMRTRPCPGFVTCREETIPNFLVSTVAEIGLRAVPKSLWDSYYWIDEVILDVLVFCVVIAFIDEAARHSKQKLIERHWLVLAAALICAVSFAIHHGLPMNRQMTLISRDLNICAVILDLILWSLLL